MKSKYPVTFIEINISIFVVVFVLQVHNTRSKEKNGQTVKMISN